MKKLLLMFGLLLVAYSAHGQSVGEVGVCEGDTFEVTTANTISCTVTGVNVTHLLAVAIAGICDANNTLSGCNGNFSYTTSSIAVTDSCGMTWTQRYHMRVSTTSGNYSTGDVSFNDATTGTCTGNITFTANFASTNLVWIQIALFSNVNTTSYFDTKNAVQYNSTCPSSSTGVNGYWSVPLTVASGKTYHPEWSTVASCIADFNTLGMVVAYFTPSTELLVTIGNGGCCTPTTVIPNSHGEVWNLWQPINTTFAWFQEPGAGGTGSLGVGEKYRRRYN